MQEYKLFSAKTKCYYQTVLLSFRLNGHIFRFHLTDQDLKVGLVLVKLRFRICDPISD